MILALTVLFVTALFVFAYHYERNGNPWNLGEFFSRLIWAASFAIGYAALGFLFTVYLLMVVWMVVAGFIEILIPHAFAQRMGNRTEDWTTLPAAKWWPAWWMKFFMNKLSYKWQDFIGMGSTGLLRGLVVFLPPCLFGVFGLGGWLAVLVTALWQPSAYWVGYRTPFNIWNNAANSAEWGEFFTPIGWVAALLCALCVA